MNTSASSDALHAPVRVKFRCCESRVEGFLCAMFRSRGREVLRRLWGSMVVRHFGSAPALTRFLLFVPGRVVGQEYLVPCPCSAFNVNVQPRPAANVKSIGPTTPMVETNRSHISSERGTWTCCPQSLPRLRQRREEVAVAVARSMGPANQR